MILQAVLATAIVVAPFDDDDTDRTFDHAALRLTDVARLGPLSPISPAVLDDTNEATQDALGDETATPHPKFGTRDTWRIGVWTGGGGSLQADRKNWMAIGGVTFSYFVLDDFSLDFEINGMFVDQQQAADAWGTNLTMLFRWHFFTRPSWSLYFDGGAGVSYFGHPVPPGGSNFNFSPQAGGGLTYKLNEEDVRLMVGARWLHYSNGSTQFDNPGVDNIIGYVQVTWPF